MVLAANSQTGFAYIEGIKSEDVLLNPGSREVTVNVTIESEPGSGCPQQFNIAKPPIVLVHGYASDSETWSSPFLNVLSNSRPAEFVIPIEYGVRIESGGKNSYGNTYGALEDLVWALDAALKSVEVRSTSLRTNWAFTRYDVTAHSQGGLLTRMLAASDDAPLSIEIFRKENNYYRGRFHRIVTVDSPHNGSVIPYYLKAIGPGLRALIPAALSFFGILQDKFDPFGPQITNLNALAIDPGAKFHLIRTTIAGGLAPFGPPLSPGCPLSYYASGLCSPFRGPALLPRGSDGGVDFDSTGAGLGTSNTVIIGENISHSGPAWVFGVSGDETATRDPAVANRVAQLLNGPASDFGPFIKPNNLDLTRKMQIDRLAVLVTFSDLISPVLPSPIPANKPGSPALSPDTSTNFDFTLQPLASEPLDGHVGWSVEVFGTNGVSTDGVSLAVDTNDSRHVTVSVDAATKGTVVLYANYTSTNGALVLAKPIIVVEKPVGTSLVGIEVRPATVALATADPIDLTIWGVYENGLRSQLFVPFDSPPVFASSDPAVVAVETNNVVRLLSPGTATVSVSFRGFTNQTVVTVQGHIVEPRLVASVVSSNGQFAVTIIGSAGRQHVVEVSTNLTSWTAFTTNVLGVNGQLEFVDVTATNFPSRFYRAVLTP